jgi:hypothetical protein
MTDDTKKPTPKYPLFLPPETNAYRGIVRALQFT